MRSPPPSPAPAPVPEGPSDARRWSTVAFTIDVVTHEGQPPVIEAGHSFCSGTIVGRAR